MISRPNATLLEFTEMINEPHMDDLQNDGLETLGRDGMIKFEGIPGGHEKKEKFKATIIPVGSVFSTHFSPPTLYEEKIHLSSTDIYGIVNSCREEWMRWIIDYSEKMSKKRIYPFRQQWNLNNRDDLLAKVGPRLASAGRDLFNQIFRNHGNDNLEIIANKLKKASTETELILTIHSDDFFIPWNMIYTSPNGEELERDGSNWTPEGFWGYRHIIEHNTQKQYLPYIMKAESGEFNVGINVDTNLDNEFEVPITRPLISFFKQHHILSTTVRETKSDLGDALWDENFQDQIMLFCCHGKVTGSVAAPNFGEATLSLSDRPPDPIKVSNIQSWMGKRKFNSNPLIFMNACQGGQTSSLLYKSFVPEFLDRNANCVIGAQTDLPTVFAKEYAMRFFSQYFSGNLRVGEILRSLTRYFFKHNNPLGLVYSLYKGADTYFVPSNKDTIA